VDALPTGSVGCSSRARERVHGRPGQCSLYLHRTQEGNEESGGAEVGRQYRGCSSWAASRAAYRTYAAVGRPPRPIRAASTLTAHGQWHVNAWSVEREGRRSWLGRPARKSLEAGLDPGRGSERGQISISRAWIASVNKMQSRDRPPRGKQDEASRFSWGTGLKSWSSLCSSLPEAVHRLEDPVAAPQLPGSYTHANPRALEAEDTCYGTRPS
jgi:hypothetical protein